MDLSSLQITSDQVDSNLSSESEQLQESTWKKIVLWLCGLASSRSESAAPVIQNSERNFLQEKSLWRIVCNVNALLLLVVNVFLWGYFA